MELLEKLGINPVLLITQIINFLILLFLLKKFLYKPILDMLERRRKKISDSLEKAEEITKKYEETERIQEKKLQQVQLRSSEILRQTKERAEKMRQEILKKSEEEAKQVLEKARKEIKNEKTNMLEEAKKEIANVTVVALKKVLEDHLDKKSQEKLAEGAVEEMKKVYKS
ncbi:MAG: F0F1 ATP synthase subunit B [Patescibacteria group bacterium]